MNPKNFWATNFFGTIQFLVKKIRASKILGPKKILSPKKFGSKKTFGLKTFLVLKNFWLKNMLDPKMLSLKKKF